MREFWGKYRGRVLDNVDPLMLGRLQVVVPSATGDTMLNWAMPCVPYAGREVGFCLTPPIDAAVWIEFEGGDPNWPIWTGCFWEEGERPNFADPPTRHMIRTGSAALMLDDTPGDGGFALTVTDPAVETPVRIAGTTAGLTIDCGEARLTLDANSVTIVVGNAAASTTAQGIRLTHGAATIVLADPVVAISGEESAGA